MSTQSPNGKTAVVTGSGTGLGFAATKRLTEAGPPIPTPSHYTQL